MAKKGWAREQLAGIRHPNLFLVLSQGRLWRWRVTIGSRPVRSNPTTDIQVGELEAIMIFNIKLQKMHNLGFYRYEPRTRSRAAVLVSAAVATLGLFHSVIPASAESVEQSFRTECRKAHSGGCSANGQGVYQAPTGYYIEKDSISSGEPLNYWMKQPRCYQPQLDGSVSIPFPGTTAMATFYTSFKAPMHVESGSGMANIGKVAFVNCRYRFRISRLPGN